MNGCSNDGLFDQFEISEHLTNSQADKRNIQRVLNFGRFKIFTHRTCFVSTFTKEDLWSMGNDHTIKGHQ